jgi:DNA replication and repair protein RecF
MHLQQLKLTNFKNYEAQTLDFSPRLNCLTGLNGMGKTNVLDAVHYLCLCKSHLGVLDKNLVKHGFTFFRLEGTFEREELKEKIVAKFIPNQKKEIERNGTVYQKLAEHIGQFPVVMIAPDDVSLVQEGSEERRRFLDTTLSQIYPDYLSNLLIYNALLKQRNALLKQMGENRHFDAVLLESIDRQMPTPAQAIFEKRKEFTKKFEPIFSRLYGIISNQAEAVGVRFDADLNDANLETLFTQNLERDRIMQRTHKGIHRDDLTLMMDGFVVKKFASQGQLKSFLLALRLAQYEILQTEKGIKPILLLDDIFDKLDENRVTQLLELLFQRDFGQIFITDTQHGRMQQIISKFSTDFKLFEVKNGAIC